MGMHTLKGRVEQTILPSQIVESTRQGIRNVRTQIMECRTCCCMHIACAVRRLTKNGGLCRAPRHS